MGPASFILSEDVTIAGQNQMGLRAQKPDWLDLRRGMDREEGDSEGRRVSHFTDETTNRVFWRHYRLLHDIRYRISHGQGLYLQRSPSGRRVVLR